LCEAERVEIGSEVAARTVGGEQAQHAGLLAGVLVTHRHAGNAVVALLLCGLDARDGRAVRNIARFAPLEGLEVTCPFGRNGRSVGQPRVVQGFDVIGVAASELGRLEKLADQVCTHITTGRKGGLQPSVLAERRDFRPVFKSDRLFMRMTGDNPTNYTLGLPQCGNPWPGPETGCGMVSPASVASWWRFHRFCRRVLPERSRESSASCGSSGAAAFQISSVCSMLARSERSHTSSKCCCSGTALARLLRAARPCGRSASGRNR